jgi:hypothetical protein
VHTLALDLLSTNCIMLYNFDCQLFKGHILKCVVFVWSTLITYLTWIRFLREHCNDIDGYSLWSCVVNFLFFLFDGWEILDGYHFDSVLVISFIIHYRAHLAYHDGNWSCTDVYFNLHHSIVFPFFWCFLNRHCSV